MSMQSAPHTNGTSSPAPGMGEREFWTIVRASLLNIVSAIEKRYDVGTKRREGVSPKS